MALLKFKRSAVPGKVPTLADLSLGELAINTFDGKVYIRKDSGTASIVEVGGGSGVLSFNSRTGAVTLTSGDVTGALGYTPYNSSNPSGYISGINSSMVTTALGYTPANRAGDTFTGLVSISGSGVTPAVRLLNSVGGRDYRVWQKDDGRLTITDETAGAERLVINSSGAMQLSVGGVSATHQFLYNESGAEIQLSDATGNGPILIDNSGGLARFYKVGAGGMAVGTTGTGAFQFLTNNTERMRIDSAGSVGIGTSSPRGRLTVGAGAVGGNPTHSGDIVVRSGMANLTSQGGLEFQSTTFSNGYGFRLSTPDFGGGSTPLVIESRSDSAAWTERMRIDSSGNVGIGTSSPVARLTASAVGGTVPTFTIPDPTNNRFSVGLGSINVFNEGQRLDFYAGDSGANGTNLGSGALRMSLTAVGNFGIGTTAPASLLHVKRGSNAIEVYPAGTWATRVINATDGSGENGLLVGNRWAGTGSTVFEAGSIFGGGTGSWYSYYRIDGTGQSIWSNSGTERMRLNTSGNLGIGTSSPSARLDVNGTGYFNSSVQFFPQDGFRFNTASAITAMRFGSAFTGESTAELAYNRATAAVTISVGNTGSSLNERMRIDSGGRVGIGTSVPSALLDVRSGAGSDSQIANRAGNAAYMVLQGTSFPNFNQVQSFDGSGNLYWSIGGSGTANTLAFLTNGSNERARINEFGQFLIGTTVGGRTVCINAADNWIRQSNPSRSWLHGMGNGTGYIIYDETAGGARFSIDTQGNWFGTNAIALGGGFNNDNRIEVGLGRTGNNYAYIDLIGDTTYTDFGLRLLRGDTGPNTFSQLFHRGTGDFQIGNIEAAALTFRTSNTERMRISASGGVAIGGTGTDASLHIQTSYGGYDRLTQIAPSVANKPAFNIMAAKNSGGTDLWWSWGVDTSNRWRINQGVGFSTNGIILDDVGNLTVAQNVTAYSDARLKKDVETISGALELVSKMRGVRYTRIDTENRNVGVIAQEMLEVVPEVVQQGVGDDDTLSVAYGNLVGVLIEAIKELEARVAELEGK